MKIINILGSPRKNGTSARIATAFTEEAEQRGATVVSYFLNGMNFRGCQGCETCHTKAESCALKDDLTPVLEGLHEADIMVLSSPVYFGGTTGQFKSFFDRTFSLIKPSFKEDPASASRLRPGKKAVLVLTQGQVDEGHRDILDRYGLFFELFGLDLSIIRGTGLDGSPEADVSTQEEEARGLARQLVQ